MGSVNFDTNVLKNVNITKTVNLTVDKTVLSAVQLTGNLATAEASADAIGGDPVQGGGGTLEKIQFTVDDFDDTDRIEANIVAGTDPAQSPVPIPVTTDLVGFERTLYVDTQSGAADLGVSNPQLGALTFNQGVDSYSNAYASYEGPAFDAAPYADNNAEIVQNFNDNFDPAAADPLADVCDTYTFSGANWDPGLDAQDNVATLRVTLVVGSGTGDADPTNDNYTATTALFVASEDGEGFTDLSITGAVAALIDQGIADTAFPAGTVIAEDVNGAKIVQLGTNVDVDGNGDSVDFGNIDYFEFIFEDDPNEAIGINADGVGLSTGGDPFTSIDVVGPVGGVSDLVNGGFINEVLSVSGSDADVQDFTYTTCEERGDYGLLAEVDTFAQVEENGAFAFSESLAALDLLI